MDERRLVVMPSVSRKAGGSSERAPPERKVIRGRVASRRHLWFARRSLKTSVWLVQAGIPRIRQGYPVCAWAAGSPTETAWAVTSPPAHRTLLVASNLIETVPLN